VTGLVGHVTGLAGHVTGLAGHVTGLAGHVTGLVGHVAGLAGHVTAPGAPRRALRIRPAPAPGRLGSSEGAGEPAQGWPALCGHGSCLRRCPTDHSPLEPNTGCCQARWLDTYLIG
jgi:hypothetical protein